MKLELNYNLVLEATDDGDGVSVDVYDKVSGRSGSFALCYETNCFSDDKVLSKAQQNELDSEKVDLWLEKVGY